MQQLLYYLLLLACPVGMGLMMWFMMRGNNHSGMRQPVAPAERLLSRENARSVQAGITAAAHADGRTRDEQLTDLHDRLADLGERQRDLLAELHELEGASEPARRG